MKKHLILRTLAVCVGTALAAAAWQARAEQFSSTDTSGSYYRVGNLTGANVQDPAGQTIGQIQDFVANTKNGNLDLAVISLNRTPGVLTAVPWSLLQQTGPKTFLLKADPKTLETAQTFPANQWPDFTRPDYSRNVYAHYGLNQNAVGGNVALPAGQVYGQNTYVQPYTYSEEVGPGKPWIRPQPDGRDTFPFLHQTDSNRF